jgi:hypothetical protein
MCVRTRHRCCSTSGGGTGGMLAGEGEQSVARGRERNGNRTNSCRCPLSWQQMRRTRRTGRQRAVGHSRGRPWRRGAAGRARRRRCSMWRPSGLTKWHALHDVRRHTSLSASLSVSHSFTCATHTAAVSRSELDYLLNRFKHVTPPPHAAKIDRARFRDVLHDIFGIDDSLLMDRGAAAMSRRCACGRN